MFRQRGHVVAGNGSGVILEYATGSYPTPHGPVTVNAERGKKPHIEAPGNIEIIEK